MKKPLKNFDSLTAADIACARKEKKAKCASAKTRRVYRVVKLKTKRGAPPAWIVCATPWAYRLQQQGRGQVV